MTNITERVVRAWAGMDGKADLFDADEYYEGYMSDAEYLIERSGIRKLLEALSQPGQHPENMRRVAEEFLG